MNRHDMLLIEESGIDFAQKTAIEMNPTHTALEIESAVCAGVPAIVRRQEKRRGGIWEVGFSSHLFVNGSRLRIGTLVPEKSVKKIFTPYYIARLANAKPQLLPEDTCLREVLPALMENAAKCGLQMGLYGSLALYLLTGKPYFNKTSDLDIVVTPDNPGDRIDLPAFYAEMKRQESRFTRRIDCEVIIGGYGMKLPELFSGQKTVLCKGLYDVKIAPLRELTREAPGIGVVL